MIAPQSRLWGSVAVYQVEYPEGIENVPVKLGDPTVLAAGFLEWTLFQNPAEAQAVPDGELPSVEIGRECYATALTLGLRTEAER